MLPSFINPESVPHKPGVYIYKNKSGKIIYVGKAVDLRSRVRSYFSGNPHDAKTMKLVGNIALVETTIVESEIEALILEANLIKKHLPLYNIRLTDDKDYLYIVVTDEEFSKVITARKKDKVKAKKWFGPYPSATTVKTTLKKLRRVFPWCSGKGEGKSRADFLGRACFYYHLGLCPGACVGTISRENYLKIINMFSKFLDGKKSELFKELNEEMSNDAKDLKFEEASKIKKIIEGMNYLTAPNKIINYLTDPNFLENLNSRSLKDLQKDLNLKELPERIECYDISNTSGTDATGSMVVLTRGEIDKSQYRKFKIKITGKPNDFAMHAEMMDRRLNHPEWGTPNLIIIDGGRGQVTTVQAVILRVSKDPSRVRAGQDFSRIPLFGLAKREEWLYPPEGEIIKLSKKSLSLRLLQRIRNESHRFAINYHRNLRKKAAGY